MEKDKHQSHISPASDTLDFVQPKVDSLWPAENRVRLEVEESVPATPDIHKPPLEQWNKPLINLLRTLATCFSFALIGINDSAYGALLPYIERDYDLSYLVTSLIFLMPFAGNFVATLSCHSIHIKWGQRGVAIVGPLSHLVSYIVIAVHPPYPAVLCILMLVGFGQGIQNAAWNARASKFDHINEVLGVLHACFGLGAVISPLVATAMVTHGGCPWYQYYYVMVGLAATELALLASTFWAATAEVYRREHGGTTAESTPPEDDNNNTDTDTTDASTAPNIMRQVLSSQPVWLVACFFFLYGGIEVAVGGWTVTFMMAVRHAASFPAGMTSMGFWLGLTVGRVVLGFVTARVFHGVRWAVTVYFVCTIALELVYWLVPQFYVSAVAVAGIGFFIGPMSPAVFAAVTAITPKHMHMSAVGFATAFGTGGGAVLPFVVGVMAQSRGVEVLHPYALAMVGVVLLIWLRIGMFLGSEGREEGREEKQREGNKSDKKVGVIARLRMKIKGFGKRS